VRRLLTGRRYLVGTGAAALAAVFTLSACGQQNGLTMARQACAHVKRSVSDYEQSTLAATSSVDVAQLRVEADAQLRAALPLAAAANSDDGSWNSLMTTISEGATVDEAHLIPALEGQCDLADANVNVNPQNPSSTPDT
jgi:hypothetical protein